MSTKRTDDMLNDYLDSAETAADSLAKLDPNDAASSEQLTMLAEITAALIKDAHETVTDDEKRREMTASTRNGIIALLNSIGALPLVRREILRKAALREQRLAARRAARNPIGTTGPGLPFAMSGMSQFSTAEPAQPRALTPADVGQMLTDAEGRDDLRGVLHTIGEMGPPAGWTPSREDLARLGIHLSAGELRALGIE